MLLISLKFFIFMLCLLGIYYKAGERHQWKVLLAGSAFFYLFSNPIYIIFIIISIVSTFYLMRKPSKLRFMLTVLINLGLLLVFKYSVIFGVHDLTAPLGISFYTFMTLGYAHDCYEKNIEPCDNIWHYALFIFYFPQLTQGPIGTYQDMKGQLTAYHPFEFQRIKTGAYRVIIGCFKKLVIAGRLAFYVDTVYSSPESYGGLTLIAATIFFLLELYADFSGYMDIVCGVSDMLGIRLRENFKRPLFATSVADFWRKWHITLNEWFNLHFFIPLNGAEWNRKFTRLLKKIFPRAKERNLRMLAPIMLVWSVTGIWHGANLTYLCWGVYYGLITTVSFCLSPHIKKLCKKAGWKSDSRGARRFQIIRTFILVLIGQAMFRAEKVSDIPVICRNIATATRINAGEAAALLTPFGNGNQAVASVIIIAVLITAQFIVELAKERDENAFTGHRYVYAFLMLTGIALFGVFGEPSFIYQTF